MIEGLTIEAPFDIKHIDKSDWQTYRFGQIAFNISERVEPKETDLEIYVGLEHLDPESIHIKRWGTPSDVEGTKLKVYPGDVIFGKRRAYQRKAALATFEGICSAHAMVLRPNPEVIEADLFPFFLHSDTFMHRAVDISVGSLSPTINWKTLAVQEFSLPPKEQQAKLAELLWAADDVVESYTNLQDENRHLLEVYREKVLYGHNTSITKLKTVLTKITAGKSLNGVNVSVSGKSEYGVLKVSAVGPSGFDPLENKCLIKQEEFRDDLSVKKFDLLITRANTAQLVGRVCLVEQEYSNLMLSDKTLRLEVDEEKCNKVFIHEVLKSKKVREQIEGTATGTGGAMKNISQDEIRNLSIPSLPKSKQDQLSKDIAKIESQNKQITNMIDLSMAMQRQLINQIFS